MKNALKSINKKALCGSYHIALTPSDVEYFLTALLHCGVLALYYHFTPYASKILLFLLVQSIVSVSLVVESDAR